MRKKLFAILMSAMMMVTFMPAMAFAGAIEDDVRFQDVTTFPSEVAHEWTFDKVVVAHTCSGTGVVQLKCECGQTKLVATDAEVDALFPISKKEIRDANYEINQDLKGKIAPIENHEGKLSTVKMTPEEAKAALEDAFESRLEKLVAELQAAQLESDLKVVENKDYIAFINKETKKTDTRIRELEKVEADPSYKGWYEKKHPVNGKYSKYPKSWNWKNKQEYDEYAECRAYLNKLEEAKQNIPNVYDKDAVETFIDDVVKLLVGVKPAYTSFAGTENEGAVERNVESLVGDLAVKIRIQLMSLFKERPTSEAELTGYYKLSLREDVLAVVRSLVTDYLNNLMGNVFEAGMAPLTSNGDTACYYLVTECSDCDEVVSITSATHEGAPATACGTSFECTECHKTIRLIQNDFESDVLEIIKKAEEVAKDLKGNDAKSAEADGARYPFIPEAEDLAPIEEDSFLLANYLFNIRKDTPHKLIANIESKACGNILTVACETCGESVSFTMPTTMKHTSEWVTLKDAKCTGVTGLKVKKCTECGAIDPLTFTVVYPEHSFVEKTIAPTCTLPGYTTTACEVCGQENALVTARNFVAPLGHEYEVETIAEATCESNGLLKISCKNCKQFKYLTAASLENAAYMIDLDEFAKIKDLIKNKNYMDLYEEFSRFYGDGSLKADKDVFILGVKDYLHDTTDYYFFGFGNVAGFPDLFTNPTKLPSIATAGKHNFTTWGVLSEPDCENGTIWSRKCKTCGYIDYHFEDKREGNDKLGHTPETVEVAATCGEPAYSYTYCTTCHMYLDANGKAMYLEDKTPAGLEDLGVKTYVKGSKPVVAKGAKCVPADEWTTLVDSTFTTTGTRVKKCKKCGAYCDSDDIAVKKLAKAYQPTLKAGKKQFTVKFKNASKAATGYQIAYKVTGANNYKYVKTTFKNSKTVKNLKAGKKYTVKVRAYVEEAGKTVYGKWCAVKYVKVK